MAGPTNRYNFLAEWFPNQFKSIPSIIIWTLVLIADAAIVIFAAYKLDLLIIGGSLGKLMVIVYIGIAFGLFCLESYLYNLIKK